MSNTAYRGQNRIANRRNQQVNHTADYQQQNIDYSQGNQYNEDDAPQMYVNINMTAKNHRTGETVRRKLGKGLAIYGVKAHEAALIRMFFDYDEETQRYVRNNRDANELLKRLDITVQLAGSNEDDEVDWDAFGDESDDQPEMELEQQTPAEPDATKTRPARNPRTTK